jgi:hypothetical protein
MLVLTLGHLPRTFLSMARRACAPGLAGQTLSPTQFFGPGIPPIPPLTPHPIVPIHDLHQQHSHATDTERDALDCRFGTAKPRPRPVFHSWHSTITTTTFASSNGLYKRSAPTASTPTNTEHLPLGFGLAGQNPASARSSIPGVPPLTPSLSHHLMNSVKDP